LNNPRPLSAMVVVAGNDVHHDLLTAARVLQAQLVEAGFRTRCAVGLERFVKPLPRTADTDLLVLYTSGGMVHPEQQQAFAGFVAEGKGVVALHATIVYGSDGSEGSPDWTRARTLGSRYLSHGPDGVFGHYIVEIVGDHPITSGVANFEIDDEYYHIYLIEESKVEVLVERSSSLGREPVLYVRNHGAGRVCYLSLGHDMRAWGNPGFKLLFGRAALWAGGRS
jgi:uncharacterized protein